MKVSVSTLLKEKNSTIYSTNQNASVRDAVKVMNDQQIGSLVILDEGKLVGIFTERDVLRRVVVPGLPVDSTLVSEVMTKEIDTFPPDFSVDDAMAHMNDKQHRHVPVVDGDRIVGLISIGDITRWLSQNFENEAQNLLNYYTGTYHDT
ncbi:MAG: CBS domain-containing protein [Verrucomicrobia bacterium]|nr:CBS domain-containing protein [Verrucomicrobiota bacterium]